MVDLKLKPANFLYSFFSKPLSRESFCSSFLRGKINFVRTTYPIIINNNAKRKAAIDQSAYKKSFMSKASAIMASARRLAPDPIIKVSAEILMNRR